MNNFIRINTTLCLTSDQFPQHHYDDLRNTVCDKCVSFQADACSRLLYTAWSNSTMIHTDLTTNTLDSTLQRN